MMPDPGSSLQSQLTHVPVPLPFGTSGRRGEVKHLTQLEIYLNVRAELEYLFGLAPAEGGIRRGDDFFFGYDLRPSSLAYVPTLGGGALAPAVAQAINDSGLTAVNLGPLPTPALAHFALARAAGSIMVTGSHIPFDRNGYKLNTSCGELLKGDEEPIARQVETWRHRLLSEPYARSLFDAAGQFKEPHSLSAIDPRGAASYVARYIEFFGRTALRGLSLLVYDHSAVGRDLLLETVQALGASAFPMGRSHEFVPIDTEAIDDLTLAHIERLAAAACAEHGRCAVVISTDGDSDRPLLIGLDFSHGERPRATFFSGDLVGMVVAETLQPDAVVVPISCNDAIDQSGLSPVLQPKTRIGSPYVIAGMQTAAAAGAMRVCGWEANGGFLTASPFTRDGRVLSALPTRDAFLPILTVLSRMAEQNRSMRDIFARLPPRFSRAALLRAMPRTTSLAIVAALRPKAAFESAPHLALATAPTLKKLIAEFFTATLGFGEPSTVDYTDGVRIRFANGDVAHVRPSGNADELRIYATADTQPRANAIVHAGTAEPHGILRRLAAAFGTAIS